MSRTEALRIIDAELKEWEYSMTRLPRHFTVDQLLKIVGAA